MKHFLLFLTFLLFAFQTTKNKNIQRVYFSKDSASILDVSPVDKKTKATQVFSDFVSKVGSESGSVILRGCADFDEEKKIELVDSRLAEVRSQLIKAGLPENKIISEHYSPNLNMIAKPKSVIDTAKTEERKEFLRAHNRFVEIKFLKKAN